jgi:hypothetical protein
MSISTYFRPNLHQNSHEILGVKYDKLASRMEATNGGYGSNKWWIWKRQMMDMEATNGGYGSGHKYS